MGGGLCEINGGFLVFKKEEYRTCLYADGNDLVKRVKDNIGDKNDKRP